MRREFEMTEADLDKIMDAGKPVRYIVVGGRPPRSPQQNANAAWASLGARMGFDWETVKPVDGKEPRYFTAEATEAEDSPLCESPATTAPAP